MNTRLIYWYKLFIFNYHEIISLDYYFSKQRYYLLLIRNINKINTGYFLITKVAKQLYYTLLILNALKLKYLYINKIQNPLIH